LPGSKLISIVLARLRAVKKVDLRPVLIVFLIALFVLGFGSVLSLPLVYVFGAFFVILIIAFVVLARSMIRR
jgi:hypothetical protein